MKINAHLLIVFLGLISASSFGQFSVSNDNSPPDNSAMLDVKSVSKGVLFPRMTLVQRNAIISSATGLLVFCTDNNQFYTNTGTPASPTWLAINTQWISNGTILYFNGGSVGIGTSSPSAKLDIFGNLAINGAPVFHAAGQWVGSPVGLTGPQGPTGAAGPQDIQGPAGATGQQGPMGPSVTTTKVCQSNTTYKSCSSLCASGYSAGGGCATNAPYTTGTVCAVTSNSGSCSASASGTTSYGCCCVCRL